MNGAQYICKLLQSRGVRHVFGLPGSQNAILFSELRRSSVKSIVTTNEMSAGFAALGYGSSCYMPGVMAIIGGPGFTFALTALQEARLDSIPVVCMVFERSGDKSKAYRLQQTDYASVAGSICKTIVHVGEVAEFASSFDEAMRISTSGEPGPVLMVVESALLEEQTTESPGEQSTETVDAAKSDTQHDTDSLNDYGERLISELRGKRTLMLLGRGAMPYSGQVQRLAEHLSAAVITSTSGRGVIAENHDRVLQTDLVPCSLVNEFISQFDRVLAMGIRFSENGSRGYRMKFRDDQLVHVDADEQVLGANYAPSLDVHSDVGSLVNLLLDNDINSNPCDTDLIADWRNRFRNSIDACADPVVQGLPKATSDSPNSTARQFIDSLRDLLPPDAIVVTDSGTHQMLVRKYFEVQSPSGLLVPTNFQSMGFAISVAIGAKHANPTRKLVVIMGDGGMQLSGLQLLSAVRDKLDVTVIVFNDGCFGHIRSQQIDYDGEEAGVVLPSFDLAAFADSMGATFFDGGVNAAEAVRDGINSLGVAIVELLLNEAASVRHQRTKSRIKRIAKNVLGDRLLKKLKNLRST